MNQLRNSVQLLGHLGKDADMRTLESGIPFTRTSIATQDNYVNAQGKKIEQVQWHNLVGWGKVAERMKEIMKKGAEVAIRGKLTHSTYEDKDGIRRYATDVVVQEFLVIS